MPDEFNMIVLYDFHSIKPQPLIQGGPYNGLLHNLLAAYVCYRPDVGYVSRLLRPFLTYENIATPHSYARRIVTTPLKV